MKKSLLAFLCGMLLLGTAGISSGEPIKFELNYEYSGGTNPSGPAPWLTATFADVNIDGTNFVYLTMDASGLKDNEFISRWHFNIDPNYSSSVSVFREGGTGPAIDSIKFVPIKQNGEEQEYSVGPAFEFDFGFIFETKEGEAQFGAGETLIYGFFGQNLTASLFNFQNAAGQNPFFSAAHVQSIGADGKSGFIGTGGSNATPVPEPATMLLLGFGLMGMAMIGRRLH